MTDKTTDMLVDEFLCERASFSPFSEGVHAAKLGQKYTDCPYTKNEPYERNEWIRGHQMWHDYSVQQYK
ncbi:hypothetical protein Cassandra_0354 [Pseudomonas phage Cassandra]|nr:hypothetical protein Cassandra_0354 [Pseudomonas phage Cassandra]